MEKLRTPFFLIAAICLVLVVLLQTGSGFVIPSKPGNSLNDTDLGVKLSEQPDDVKKKLNSLSQMKPPGMAIPRMALLDGLLLFTIGLMGLPYLITDRVSGKLQGILSLIVSLLALLIGILLIFVDLGRLILMLSLFLSPPFGTITYLAIWGSFNRTGAQTVLGLTLFLKFGFGIMLLLAQQRFLQNKGLMFLMGTSLLANLIVTFLHGLVPGILVSITDAIAAIIMLVFALIWALLMLIGAIIALIKAVS
jgi:hypothetical protein